ncbi:MAG: hypothetical protein IID28_13510 [Planctomycetes bacterium]|nr:hypothetical protein [Planctomycetota bacterium]
MASGKGRADAAERDRGFEVVLEVFLDVVLREPALTVAAVAGFFFEDGVVAAFDGLAVFFSGGFFFTGFLATLAAGFLVVEVFDFFAAGARAVPEAVCVFFLVTFFLAIATILDAPLRVSSCE